VRFTIDFEQVPEEGRRWFESLPEGLGSQRFFRANEYLNGYVDRLARDHVAALRSEPVAREAQWRWMLRKIERAGLAELDPWGRLATLRDPAETAEAVKQSALAELPDLAPSFALFDAARDGYPEFLRGARDGASILLAPSTLPIWQRYFDNVDEVYSANNRLAAHLVERALRSRGACELLEIGGGLGSAAQAVLARSRDRIARYRFTEPFPPFLVGARRRLAQEFAGVALEYGALDVNEPFSRQRVAERSVDVVLAVNVLHVARHVGRSLEAIRAALRPGGALVLVECVRCVPGAPIYVDYPFQLLDEFFRVEDPGPDRPHGGFLMARHWRGHLARAGFELEVELPDHDKAARWYEGTHLAGFLASARR
jgi:SAM-dependent methyltransferase